MTRRMMSNKGTSGGTTKGHPKGNRRSTPASSQQVAPPTTNHQPLLNNNNNTKSNPVQCSSLVVVPQATVVAAATTTNANKNKPPPQSSNKQSNSIVAASTSTSSKVLKEKNGQQLLETSIPPAPSTSPIPGAEELELDVEGDDPEDVDVDVDDDDDEDEDDEDLDDEDDDEEELDDDEEYENEEVRDDLTEPCEIRTPGAGGPACNSSAPYNANFQSTSDEDDDDEGDLDESLERDESDEDDEDDEDGIEPSGFLLPTDGDPSSIQGIPPDAQARLEAFFEAAGTGFTDGKLMSDPENLRKLTLTVSSALGEASAAINRMRDSQRKSLEEGRNDSMEEGDSLLALACSSGYFELARVLLAMGANVDDRGSKGDLTPMMDAASQGHLEIVKLLITHGAEVNAQSACGNSPLMYAAAAGHEDIVKELLKSGARVEDNNENGHTPLMEAASSGHVNVAKILLEQGAGINTHSNEFKESALTVACYKGHLEMVRFLLAAGADQQHKTDEMHTALMEASMDGHVEVARLLLDCGAQVNMPADSFESPLTLAACGGHVELAELLIERGANIEEVNDEGYTPLMEAAREGHHHVVKCLLNAGASINAETDETHETALTLSACGGFLDVVDTLCQRGADIEAGASTPLMEASQEGHFQVVQYLLDHGADITRETQTGDTALSYACENGHVEVVQLLIEKGANPEHLSEGARTPLMKACRGGHVDVIKFLLLKGVDVNRQTASNDHTPLSLACAGGHMSAVEVLLAAGANPYHKLKDNSTMIIEAARGGHTSVIRALLDHAPPRGADGKGKPQPKGQSGQQQQKTGQAGADKGGNQGKSVLRKCRSSTALDSSQQTPQPTGSTATPSGETKAKPLPAQIMTSIPADSPILKSLNLPLGDGKPQVSEEMRKKPVSVPTPSSTMPAADKNAVPAANRKTATPSTATPPTAANNVCTECNNAKTEQPHGHIHVKRSAAEVTTASAAVASPSPNAVASATPTPANNAAGAGSSPGSSGGPPLVPSQVTAATAISERPKAKANKPSARKQVQLQNQLLQAAGGSPPSGLGQSPGGAGSSTSPSGGVAAVQHDCARTTGSATSSGGTAGGPSGLKVAATAPLPPNPSPPYIGTPSALLQMQVQQVRSAGKCNVSSTTSSSSSSSSTSETHFTLDANQLMQIFTQHQSQLVYKGERGEFKFDAAGLNYDVENSGMIDIAQFVASTTYPPPGPTPLQLTASTSSPGVGGGSAAVVIPPPPSAVGTTTTTTTTTVVVTHGNGETETIIEGDNLPPGANEMIMSAAAAAFPLDCYPMTASSSSGGQVQVQSYQLTGGDVVSPQQTTTTMHTTTVINNSGGVGNAAAAASNIQTQIVLPTTKAHHPPPLPIAFQEAAAAAGILPPSGAPPAPELRQQHSKTPVAKAVASQTTTPHLKEKSIITKAVSTTATSLTQKKQTAKRTRPFGTGSNGATHCQKGGSHSQTTQTSGEKTQKALDVDSATDSNGETSLSIACGQGHYEVVEFLLSRNAHIEHRDKKGCTPLILAADGGHDKVVELLLQRGAEIEAQSERTKDTALSLACTKGRYEVVELLLKKSANKEHRNVSDYTPLSLAASGGFVNIIKLLLTNGAEINSRTGSKLGISPLMLAAMNGNTAAVKLLLDMGSDINAQIETNKNTALTLACFQGRHEVVQLLLDRKANLEHRAKTGLTPLMEAANGGYVEVGKVLIEKGADANAPPVPATRDTALTIAADKGHFRFVEMLIACHANVDVRNKKGCTPLWLACNGGHLDVCQALQKAHADVDAQDNRRISCLMASFKKGHVKVVRWIVKYVKQFPNDTEMSRYFIGIANENELLKKAQQCMEYIKQAKDKQALEASKNANILLEELEQEKSREENKRLAAAKRREKKKKKKQEKKQQFPQDDDREADNEEEDDNEDGDDDIVELVDSGIDVNSLSTDPKQKGSSSQSSKQQSKGNKENLQQPLQQKQAMGGKSASSKSIKDVANTLESASDRLGQQAVLTSTYSEPPAKTAGSELASKNRKKKKDKKSETLSEVSNVHHHDVSSTTAKSSSNEKENVLAKGKPSVAATGKTVEKDILKEKVKEVEDMSNSVAGKQKKDKKNIREISEKLKDTDAKESNQVPNQTNKVSTTTHSAPVVTSKKGGKSSEGFQVPEPLMGISLNPPHRKGAFEGHDSYSAVSGTSHATSGPAAPISTTTTVSSGKTSGTTPVKPSGRKDDGWKEVTRSCPSSRSKKVIVPSSVISRVIGRGGCNINAIREATNAHIEVEKQQKGQVQPERTIQIKGTVEATKQAYSLITALMNEPDVDIKKLIPQQRLGGGSTPASSQTSGSTNNSSTPTPILSSTNAFPVIGSASTPLPPIGQPMTAAQTNSTSSTAPVDVHKSHNKSTLKGSPTPKHVSSSSVSPPLNYMNKTGGSSPPIKKPTVVSSSHHHHHHNHHQNAGNFEIGNFSVSDVNPDIYTNKSYTGMIGKKSLIFTPSSSAVGATNTSNSTTTSFASKLGHQQQSHNHQLHHDSTSSSSANQNWNDGGSNSRQRNNATPISSSTEQMKFITSATPPPQTAPQQQSSSVNNGQTHHQPQQQSNQPTQQRVPLQQHQQAPPQQPHMMNQTNAERQMQTLQNLVQNFNNAVHNSGQHQNIIKEHEIPNGPGSPADSFGNQQRHPAPQQQQQPLLNQQQHPSGTVIGVSNTGSERSSSEASNQEQQPPPIEYSPFNYSFSKTTGWFPGDLAVREPSMQQQQGGIHQQFGGVSNLLSSLTTGGSTSSLSAARAMNFASVAASGISASMSTTTAQISQAVIGQNNGGPTKSSSIDQLELEHHKADAAKAPGYRMKDDSRPSPMNQVNTTMGSPILRAVTGNPTNTGFNMDGPLSSQFAASAGLTHGNIMNQFNSRPNNYGTAPGSQFQPQPQQQDPMAMMNSQPGINGGMMYQQQQQNNSGSHPLVVPPIPTTVPTNVVLSSRLNPRAPSFMVKVQPGQPPIAMSSQSQGVGGGGNSAFVPTQQSQSQFNNLQQYKQNIGGVVGGLGQQFGGRGGGGGLNPRNQGIGSGWSAYGNGSTDDISNFAGLSGLIDPQAILLGAMDNNTNMHDNQNAMKMDDRRLPRPIGGERTTWKSGTTGTIGNLPFNPMDGLDTGIPPPNISGHGPQQQGGNSWLGMYGSNQPQPGYHGSAGQQPIHGPQVSAPQRGGDNRGVLGGGRRYMDDSDANRLLEMQQMYDGQRMMNGGNVPPMMHMQNSLPQQHPNAGMYPYGLEQHMDQQQHNINNMPKLDQQWDTQHLLMDDKHLQGGWGGNKWGN